MGMPAEDLEKYANEKPAAPETTEKSPTDPVNPSTDKPAEPKVESEVK